MNRIALLLLTLAASCLAAIAADTSPATSPAPLASRLGSATARAAYEEFVADVLAAAGKQAAAFTALERDVTRLSADKAREQLAFLETLALTRGQLSQSRRAILGCTQLTREESELILGELDAVKIRWDKLLAEEVPARKAALVRQLDIAAVAVMPQAAPPAPTPRTPAEVLAAARSRLRPMGTALIGSEYHLLLDGQRLRAGQTITVKLERDYVVTIAGVTKTAYTLALGDQTLLVPLE
ncbi:MAG: hypothetical protein IAE82_15010 [Opitutaceae bacterium]|nr:hypothetical protein [Opitutaceae bacterium]